MSGQTATAVLATTTVAAPRLRPIDVVLSVSEVTDESALVTWRLFSPEERKRIDGVQLRFTAVDSSTGSPASAVPGTSPFVHRDTNFFRLRELSAGTEYELDLYLIPSPGAGPEYVSEKEVKFVTREPERGKKTGMMPSSGTSRYQRTINAILLFTLADPFSFNLILTTTSVSPRSISLSWRGVPRPHHQYASLYRVLAAEHHVNAMDDAVSVYVESTAATPTATTVAGLRPATHYQVWLEAYLRNGRIAKSNVLDVLTEDAFGDNDVVPGN